ncbi:MAG: glycosyltransferase [Methanothrix sp.]
MYSIVIPAYNEELRLKGIIYQYAKEFADQEIIIVCDGEDNSRDIVNGACIKNPNIKLLSFERRLGKGGALIEGFKVAAGERIGFVDADESVSPKDLKGMFRALDEVDGVIASRRLKTSKILIKQPLRRRVVSKGFNLFVRILFGLPFRDTQCGAKVFKREAIKYIVNDLTAKGFEIDVEILWRLKKGGYRAIEYPITWKHSEGSKFKLSHSGRMLISLLRIRFNG